VQKNGRFLHDLIMDSTTYHQGAVYEIGSLKAKDMNRMYRKAHKQFYLKPSQIWRAINLNIKSLGIFLGLMRYGLSILLKGGEVPNRKRKQCY
jgi:hypothetical protein